jgi:FkbM family methyltransferase
MTVSLKKGFRAIFIEHRMPYTLGIWLDRLCVFFNLKHKIITCQGIKIKVRRLTKDHFFIHDIIERKDYNPPGYEIREDDIVIDVGAHIGTFSLMAAKAARRGMVYAFEPEAEAYRLLLENIGMNGFDNILAMNTGIYSERKSLLLNVFDTDNTGLSSIYDRDDNKLKKRILIECVTLEEVFEKNGIEKCGFLKMDCEGSEFPVLHGLPRKYFDRIDRIAMEYHEQPPQYTVEKLAAHLELMGFTVDKIGREGDADYKGKLLYARRR